jgi:hypothetical protein
VTCIRKLARLRNTSKTLKKRERDGQQFGRGPNLGRVTVQACRDFGGIGVIVDAATHFQQLGDGDVVAVGHSREVLRDSYQDDDGRGDDATGPGEQAQSRRSLDAILKWVSALNGLVAPSNVVP